MSGEQAEPVSDERAFNYLLRERLAEQRAATHARLFGEPTTEPAEQAEGGEDTDQADQADRAEQGDQPEPAA